MPRPRRPLTEDEQARPCARCGAKAGERCAKPGGQLHYGMHKSRKAGRPARRGTAVKDGGSRGTA